MDPRGGRRHNPRVPSRAHLAWGLGLLLVVLHLIPWGWSGDWAPGLPAELGFRLLWMGAAFAYLWWFCGTIWRDEA